MSVVFFLAFTTVALKESTTERISPFLFIKFALEFCA